MADTKLIATELVPDPLARVRQENLRELQLYIYHMLVYVSILILGLGVLRDCNNP
jgi:hypothetical protein